MSKDKEAEDRIFSYIGDGRSVLLPMEEIAILMPRCRKCGDIVQMLTSQQRINSVVVYCRTCMQNSKRTRR